MGINKYLNFSKDETSVLSLIAFLFNEIWHVICGTLRDLVPFLQFKKREKTHGGVLLLVKFKLN